VVVLDGVTRLTRAYNVAAPASGRVLEGGVDAAAVFATKRLLGAARRLEEGGSLTILASALVESGSVTERVIFEELRDTANLELRLDRRLAEQRTYPAVDLAASSTRHEELLLSEEELRASWQLRRQGDLGSLLQKLAQTRTNAELVGEVAGTAGDPLPLEGSL
jgi:transcription termination factor Rho